MAGPGLSYDQAPPFGTPLRLFLVAPMFLILAALLAMFAPDAWLASRWTPSSLALTHLLTLGYLGTTMVGALLQMLPVVVGSPVPYAEPIGWLAIIGISFGTLLLVTGFLVGDPTLLMLATVFLSIGLVPFLAGTLLSLIRARALPQVAWPMRQAWLALAVTFALGVVLATGLAGLWNTPDLLSLTGLHAAWGLGGWVLVLVIGVAYQVVPMLQLTPPYAKGITLALTWSLPIALMVFTLAWFLPSPAARGVEALALLVGMGANLAFALATLKLQGQRRRKMPDVTLDFWRLGMASLIGVAVLFPAAIIEANPWRDATQILLGLLFLLGFAASVVNGMLYKIVPFLGWFHLQAQTKAGAGKIPNMKQFISNDAARWHFRLHLAAVVLLLPTPWLPPQLALAGLALLVVSGLALEMNLRRARKIFLSHGGRH
ncbi:MAG: hypothetical protein H6935_16135 [Thiobacillus sp.]|nr:hypothetical protein [Thiobacillus sp.]